MWSLYLGRPSGIGIRNITVQRPATDTERMWKPYPRPRSQSLVPEEGIPFDLEALTDANIKLCEFMRSINIQLYSGRTITIDEMCRFLVQTKQELFSWLDNMPLNLKIDLASLHRVYAPAVLQLHMQFYASLIALYRPYLSSTLLRRKDDVTSSADREALVAAPVECIEAAHQIAETLRCYQRQHSLRRSNIQIVHIIFTASLVFIYDVCSRTYSDSRASLNDLQFCCHSLGEIGRCYGNSTRALEVIILVKQEWLRISESSRMRGRTAQLKRRPSNVNQFDISGHEDDRSKRRHHRPSASDSEAMEPPIFQLMPQSFSSYQVSCDDFMGQTNNWAMQTVEEGMYEALQMPHGMDLGLGDMMPTMDWLDPQPPHQGMVFTGRVEAGDNTASGSPENQGGTAR